MKPFLSIIVPCYNTKPENMETILTSIISQNMNEDIEVIIADDCSTDKSYFSILEKYEELDIKIIETDYNFGPGNTREKGISIANGEWITFIDHDDNFVPDTFKSVKQYIKDNEISTILSTDTILVSKDNTQIHLMNVQYCILHGKFFNKAFWNKYDIHFKKDLYGAEDVYIFTVLNYIHITFNEVYHNYHIHTYNWVNDFTSISRSHNKGYNTYSEKTYDDYITATFRTIVELKNKEENPLDESFAFSQSLKILINCYILLKGYIHTYKIKFRKENLIYFCNLYSEFCDEFSVDYNFIIRKLIVDKWRMFYECGDELSELCGYLKSANPRNFYVWLKIIDKLIPIRE